MAKPKITLTQLLEQYDQERLTGDEFIEAFEKVMKYVEEKNTASKKELTEIGEAMAKRFVEFREGIAADLAEAKDGGSATKADIEARMQRIEAQIAERLASLRDGESPDAQAIIDALIPHIPPPIPGSADNAEDIRNKLEALPEGDKLAIAAIEDLEKRLDDLAKRISKIGPVFVGGGGSGGGRVVKSHDLSPDLDGILKTFSLPAFYRVISVHTSSAPFILRPTDDYTVDAAAMTITFTSEIDAATTLAAGQTITIIYSES